MPTKTGSGIIHDGLAMNFDASEHRSSYGPNLLSKHLYTNNQNVTVTKNPDGSIRAVDNQGSSTPGLWPLGVGADSSGDLQVVAGRDYLFRTYAKFNGGGGSVNNYVYSNNNGNLVWVGSPINSENYQWVENAFNTGTSTRLRPGILWSSSSNGSSFTVKEWRLHDRSRWWDSTGKHPGMIRYNGPTHTDRTVNANGTVEAGYFRFDGVDDFMEDQFSPVTQIAYPTSECWFRPQGEPGAGYHSIFQKDGGYSGGATYGIRATSGTSPYPYASIWYSSTSGDLISVSAPNSQMSWGTWYHIVSTYDGTNLRIYVNGELQGENTGGAGRATYQPNGYFRIGNGDSRYANGDLGAVRVYNRPLTAVEVRQNYNAVKSMYGHGA